MPLPSTSDLQALLSPRRRYLIGVSGGADSVALLHLLLAAGIRKLIVCHVDHQLRAAASRADARFVETLCHQHALPFHLARMPVKALAKQRGESIETTARHARHEFFASIAQKENSPHLLLAHHADDQAETMLWNLLRGSHGFKGMRAQQELRIATQKLHISRPLLLTRRAELQAYLLENQIPWREDASNATAVATRNRIRLEVLPLLCDIARRDVTPLLLRQLSSQDDLDAVEQWALEQTQATDPQGRLHVPAMQSLPPALQNLVLREHLTHHKVPDLSRELLDRCRTLLTDLKVHAINLPGGFTLRRKSARITCHAPPTH
jgi:tRNA(Ile)-lysidine synthase